MLLNPLLEDRTSRNRILAFILGALLGSMVLFVFVSIRRGRDPVGFIRTTESATRLLDERAQAVAGDGGKDAAPHKAHLPRFPITYETARRIFPIDGEVQEFDPQVYFRRQSNLDRWINWKEHSAGHWKLRTNALGLREDAEPKAKKPDLRILVTGDSHAEGVCNNSETLTHILERALSVAHPDKSIEAINAAKGGYSFYNYLGTLEKFLYLRPDVFIVVVYGANDFEEVLTPYHYFSGTARRPGSTEYWPLVERALNISGRWVPQDGMSLKYFQEQPSEIEVALRAGAGATLDIQDICRANGIALIYVYVPSRIDGEDPKFLADPSHPNLAQELYAALEIRPESVTVHNGMANVLMAFLAEKKIPALDARDVFSKSTGPFYWCEDHHINVNAHRLIGEALVPVVEKLDLAGLR